MNITSPVPIRSGTVPAWFETIRLTPGGSVLYPVGVIMSIMDLECSI